MDIFIISPEDKENFKRLDAFLAQQLPDFSRNLIKKFFEDQLFTSEHKLELKKMPPVGTQIVFHRPEPTSVEIKPQDIPIEILFEDQHLIVVNKPAGLVVHPAAGNPDGTLVNALLFHIKDLSGIGNELRPGIVHRLDKGTSGVMVAAKSQVCHEGLVELFATHNIERKYQTITLGSRLESEQTITSLIARNRNNRLKMTSKTHRGKEAITHVKVTEYFKNLSHVECTLETGRTHQIRVHLSEQLNTPILNDPTYGRAGDEKSLLSNEMKGLLKNYPHPLLHAKTLGFVHPVTKKNLYFEQAPPEIFQSCLHQLRTENE